VLGEEQRREKVPDQQDVVPRPNLDRGAVGLMEEEEWLDRTLFLFLIIERP
jgi:hypothetical protein